MAMFLTPNTKFKPFSYQEMLAPVLAYKEAYDAADEELNTLMEDAASKAFNFAPQDSKEKAQYDDIMTKLKTASDNLASGDVNAFKDIRNINKEYRKTMIPIQQKIAKRSELAAEQRKLLSSNPNLRFTKDYSLESLDNITSNSTYNIIDLKDLEESVGENFAKEMAGFVRTDFDSTPIGDTGYSYVTQGNGLSSSEFDLLINSDAILQTTGDYNNVYKTYKKHADEIDARTDISSTIKDEMKQAVKRGMRANAGKFTTDVVKTHSSKEEREKFNIMSVDENGNALATYNGAVMKGKVKPDGKGGYVPIDIENWKKIGSENKPGGGANGGSGSSSSSSGSGSGEKPAGKLVETEKTDAYGRTTKERRIEQNLTKPELDSLQQKRAEDLAKLLEGIKTQ